jgi:hypothetical protein
MILVVGIVWKAKVHHLKCVEKHFLFEKKQTRNVSFRECSMLSFPFFHVTVGKNILNSLLKIVKTLKKLFSAASPVQLKIFGE